MNTTSFGPVKIHFFGHASVLLEYNGATFYIDPYVLPKNPRTANVILHTHSHADHCVLPSSINGSKTQVISRGGKFPGMEIKIGETIKTNGAIIEAVHAYNLNKEFHPKGAGAGYIFTFPSAREPVKIYIAGDTDLIPEMGSYKCDVAILPIGGTYTMNADEAAEAVAQIKPKVAIPYHYNYLEGTRANAQEFASLAKTLSPSTIITILSAESQLR
ncbi:MAG: MBL fold metallo-hydrolase [Candidatus Micrarchaeota archaeon]